MKDLFNNQLDIFTNTHNKMETKTIKIYEFAELSREAQERACKTWLEERDDYFFTEDWRASLKAFESVFGIRTDYSVGTCSHSYCDLKDYSWDNETSELMGARLIAYIYNNYFWNLFSGKYYFLYSKKDTYFNEAHQKDWPVTKTRKSKVLIDHSCELTGVCTDENLLYPIYQFLAGRHEEQSYITFEGLIKDCLAAWADDWKKDMEYQESKEFAEEELMQADDKQFLETGEEYIY